MSLQLVWLPFAAKQMIKQGGSGRIINISSVHEDWPMPGNSPYCLSKGGMRMLTRTAGVELAPHNILVVGAGPGAVATPINRSTLQTAEDSERAWAPGCASGKRRR
jgi:glucose 1-dehydrogenase